MFHIFPIKKTHYNQPFLSLVWSSEPRQVLIIGHLCSMAALGRSQDRNCWAFWWDQRDLTCKIFHFTNGLIIKRWIFLPKVVGFTTQH